MIKGWHTTDKNVATRFVNLNWVYICTINLDFVFTLTNVEKLVRISQ